MTDTDDPASIGAYEEAARVLGFDPVSLAGEPAPTPDLTQPVRRGDYLRKAIPLGTLTPRQLVNGMLGMMQLHRALTKNHLAEEETPVLAQAIVGLANRVASSYARQLKQRQEMEPAKITAFETYLAHLRSLPPPKGNAVTQPRGPRSRFIETQHQSPLDRLVRAFTLLNPLGLSGSRMQIMLSETAQRHPGFQPPSDSKIRSWRQRIYMPFKILEYTGITKGKDLEARSGRPWPIPCLPSTDNKPVRALFMTMAEQGHWDLLLSPLHLFHVQAWAMRSYASLLEKRELDVCPITRLGVQWFRNDNEDKTDIRYLVEAYRKLYDLNRERGGSLFAGAVILPFYERRMLNDEVTHLWLKYAHRHHASVVGTGARPAAAACTILNFGQVLAWEMDDRGADLTFADLHTKAQITGTMLSEADFRQQRGYDE